MTSGIPPDDIKALLKTCTGNTFVDRRDLAILRVFIDTGCRLEEITNLTPANINLENDELLVTGKGNRQRVLSIGPKTALALSRF